MLTAFLAQLQPRMLSLQEKISKQMVQLIGAIASCQQRLDTLEHTTNRLLEMLEGIASQRLEN
jgi:hypothetical protein